MEGMSDINSFIKLIKFYKYQRNPTKSEYTSTFKAVREIITLNPENPYRYDLLTAMYSIGIVVGKCKSNLICMSKAIEANKKSLSINNNNPLAHYALGWIFVIKKENSKAMSSFKKAISFDHTFPT
ncbi:MAG: hypothetical protein DRQ64_10405 [Gammaproteobacteria bacterium]|nr:MAG: hypothetical protein DRQ64_10405 [Gammaproteobacteria bacterium]